MGPSAVTDLDRFTDNELCQMHIDAGKRALAHYKRVENLVGFMSRMDVNDPDYAGVASTMDTCMWAGNEAHELQQEIGNVLRARRANADA